MPDPRHFAKLDLGYFDNPKIADFMDDRPRVMVLHLRAILYCRQHLTDGVFPIRAVARLAYASYCGSQCESQCDFCAAHDANLFERIDDRTATVHDYLEHQDSAERVSARKSAGQTAAAARWGGKDDAKGNAKGNATRITNGNAEKRREEKSEKGGSRRRPEAPLSSDWAPNDKHREFATSKSLDMEREAFRFRNHAQANDRRQRDWDSAFTNWLDKAFPAQTARRDRGQMPEGW